MGLNAINSIVEVPYRHLVEFKTGLLESRMKNSGGKVSGRLAAGCGKWQMVRFARFIGAQDRWRLKNRGAPRACHYKSTPGSPDENYDAAISRRFSVRARLIFEESDRRFKSRSYGVVSPGNAARPRVNCHDAIRPITIHTSKTGKIFSKLFFKYLHDRWITRDHPFPILLFRDNYGL